MEQTKFIEELCIIRPYLIDCASRLLKTSYHDAEDLTHDTILKMIQKKGYYTKEHNIRALSYIIMRNILLNNIRHHKYSEVYSKDYYRNHEIGDNTECICLNNELNCAMQKLSPKQQRVISLYIKGYSCSEIAKMESISIGIVKNRVFAARQILRMLLEDYR